MAEGEAFGEWTVAVTEADQVGITIVQVNNDGSGVETIHTAMSPSSALSFAEAITEKALEAMQASGGEFGGD